MLPLKKMGDHRRDNSFFIEEKKKEHSFYRFWALLVTDSNEFLLQSDFLKTLFIKEKRSTAFNGV